MNHMFVTCSVFHDPLSWLNAEASSANWFPLQELLDGVGRGQFEFDWKGRAMLLPRIDMQGERIWGMSLGMLDELLERIRETQ